MHRYDIPEMTCGHCAGVVEKAVETVDPRAEVTIDLAARQVTVRTRAEAAQVAEAIRSAGCEDRRLAA